MIEIGKWAPQAVAKLEKERQSIPRIKDNEIGAKLRSGEAAAAKASLMADAVMAVLQDFCRQSEVFAEAVMKGGSFVDCMKAVTKGLGNYAEGPSSCKKAVQFYLPGAEIKAQWKVEIPQQEQEAAPVAAPKPSLTLNLMDFFD